MVYAAAPECFEIRASESRAVEGDAAGDVGDWDVVRCTGAEGAEAIRQRDADLKRW
jgi:hypothetical protein